jgi:hypothetical protein
MANRKNQTQKKKPDKPRKGRPPKNAGLSATTVDDPPIPLDTEQNLPSVTSVPLTPTPHRKTLNSSADEFVSQLLGPSASAKRLKRKGAGKAKKPTLYESDDNLSGSDDDASDPSSPSTWLNNYRF